MNIFQKIKFVFKYGLTGFKQLLNKAVKPAIKVVSIVTDIIESPVASAVVAFTPTKWDDEFVKYGKILLPKVLAELVVLDGLQGKSDSEVINTIVNEVRQYTKDKRAQFYEDLTVLLSKGLSDGNIDDAELRELISFVTKK